MPSSPLPAGIPAPAFTLPAEPGREVSLEEFRGKPVVLAFYTWPQVRPDARSAMAGTAAGEPFRRYLGEHPRL
jgi:hypothetical protein